MVSVTLAGTLDLGPCSPDALRSKERNSIIGVHRSEIQPLTTSQVIQLPRKEPGCKYQPALARPGGYRAEKQCRIWISTRSEIATMIFNDIIALIGSIEASVGTKLALEAIQHQQKAMILQQLPDGANLLER